MIIKDEDGEYVMFKDLNSFDLWCAEGGWGGYDGFFQATGLSFEELQGVYFQVIHNRVFLKEVEVVR